MQKDSISDNQKLGGGGWVVTAAYYLVNIKSLFNSLVVT